MDQTIKSKIIQNGVKNLIEFGYTNVDANNIITDEVYKLFFESMLKNNLGHGYDEEINSILEDIQIINIERSK